MATITIRWPAMTERPTYDGPRYRHALGDLTGEHRCRVAEARYRRERGLPVNDRHADAFLDTPEAAVEDAAWGAA